MQGLIKGSLWQTVEMKARHQLSNCAAGTQHMVPVQLLSSKHRLKIPNACPGPKPGGGFSRDLGLRNILGGRWGIQDPRAQYRSSKLGNSHLSVPKAPSKPGGWSFLSVLFPGMAGEWHLVDRWWILLNEGHLTITHSLRAMNCGVSRFCTVDFAQ